MQSRAHIKNECALNDDTALVFARFAPAALRRALIALGLDHLPLPRPTTPSMSAAERNELEAVGVPSRVSVFIAAEECQIVLQTTPAPETLGSVSL